MTQWGVREFSTRLMRDVLATCERRGYRKPSVYEGRYGALAPRDPALLELLRRHGVRFHACG